MIGVVRGVEVDVGLDVLLDRRGSTGCSIVLMTALMVPASRRDQVDEGEDDDPHDVDEVPVQTDQLDDLGLVAGDLAPRSDDHQRQQHDDADGDVDAVEAGERVEARAEQVRGEAEALVVEGGELVDLAADERRAEQRRGDEPQRACCGRRRACAADTASTIVSELISSTNELTDVNGMS